MRIGLILGALYFLGVVFSAAAPSDLILIDSVNKKYAVENVSFEVNPQNGRAGIRLVYNNPQQLTGLEDVDRGPAPRIVSLPNLQYDASAQAIVYQQRGNSVVCATAAKRWTVFGKITYMKPTGVCSIASRLADHLSDDGWRVDRIRTLDTFLAITNR